MCKMQMQMLFINKQWMYVKSMYESAYALKWDEGMKECNAHRIPHIPLDNLPIKYSN